MQRMIANSLWFALVALLPTAVAVAEPVLPAGQEAAIGQLLGEGAELAGCRLIDARIDRDRIDGRYHCQSAGQEPVDVATVWRHAGVADPNTRAAGPWSLVLTPEFEPLRTVLTQRIIDLGDKVHWQEPQAAPTVAPVQRDQPSAAALRPMSPQAKAAYERSEQMLHDGKLLEIVDLLRPFAAKEPHPWLIGRIVVGAAAQASGPDGVATVDRWMAQADAHRDDDLAQFLAGVAVHYRGHLRASSREEKLRDYNLALQYLGRVTQRFGDSPRLWIYLAVSQLRTGHQAEAEAAIGQAVAHDDGADADIYYCRAEVYHRKNPVQALRDIERYESMMAANKTGGAWVAAKKESRVKHMHDVMTDVAAGRRVVGDEELFDPILGSGRPPWMQLGPAEISGIVLVLAALALLLRRRLRPPRGA